MINNKFECAQCDIITKGFHAFRVHLWLNHNTTYGTTIYPKDLKKEGKIVIDKIHLKYLIDGYGKPSYLPSGLFDLIKERYGKNG